MHVYLGINKTGNTAKLGLRSPSLPAYSTMTTETLSRSVSINFSIASNKADASKPTAFPQITPQGLPSLAGGTFQLPGYVPCPAYKKGNGSFRTPLPFFQILLHLADGRYDPRHHIPSGTGSEHSADGL